MIVALNVPDAGSALLVAAQLAARTVTVLVADTHAVKERPATDAAAVGTPNATASPTAAPVTVIVRSTCELAVTTPKSSVAVFVN
jgi:hypothetical protein